MGMAKAAFEQGRYQHDAYAPYWVVQRAPFQSQVFSN